MLGPYGSFTVQQTHGILWRQEHKIECSSDSLSWSSLYCSMQREHPYADSFKGIGDHLVVVHRDGPVSVTRRMGSRVVKKTVAPGGLFILPAGHDFSVELGGSLSTIHLYVRSQLVAEAAMEICKGDGADVEIVPRLGVHDPLIEHLAYVACDLVKDGVASEWAVDCLARSIALQLIRCHSTGARHNEASASGLTTDQMRKVKDYVTAHLSSGISVSDMAELIALSPVHFARQFKRSAGKTPHQYLLSERIAAARRLLHSNLPIAEIAFMCGFSHQEHMTRMFRREIGIPPGAYRKASAQPPIV
jgi:AraC family transcriptional regulator